MIQSGMIIEDRYEILEKIGTGGMSDVYKAKCHKLNRFVAIKFLKPEYCADKNFVTKFQTEAQSAAALLHPNVVSVYDVNVTNGIYYIVMEYVDGITLKKYIEINGKLGIKEATSVAIQVAQGMDAAHSAGIIHRDIKPQNVLISREGKIKVTDFGIARTTTERTLSADVLGSAQYISPEQARGGNVDKRSDIYSFGIMFYEMVTGELPFDGDTPVTVALKQIQEKLPDIREIIPDVPRSTRQIIEKCCKKRPDRRYQVVSELLADLKVSMANPNADILAISDGSSGGDTTVVMSKNDRQDLRREMRTRRRVLVDREEDEEEEEDEDIEEYDRRPDRSKKDMDKILTICGIAAGVIIVGVIIFICIKLLGGGCAGSSEQQTTTKIAQTTTTAATTTTAGAVVLEDYAGQKQSDVLVKLKNLGLTTKVTMKTSETVASGLVIETNPKAKTSVATGTVVEVIVSSGSESTTDDGLVEVPKLDGYTEEEAKTLCSSLDLNLTIKYETNNDSVGKVFQQNVAAGTRVAKKTTLEIIIGQAEETTEAPTEAKVEVPNFIGMKAESAAVECGRIELNVTFVDAEDGANVGLVIDQSIAAGDKVDPMTSIILTKGVEPATETEPQTETEPEETSTSEETTNGEN